MPDLPSNCKDMQIPERLRTGDRPVLGDPSPESLLFRWYEKGLVLLEDGTVSRSDLGRVFTDCHETSVNRGDISEPEDVLYNYGGGPHRFGYGIIVCATGAVHECTFPILYNFADGRSEMRQYTFRLLHDPKPCMYPHCLIAAFRPGGVRVENGNPPNRAEKNGLRAELGRHFRRFRSPQ